MGSINRSNSSGTPVSEIEINEALIYRLLKNQHPDLAHLPIRSVDAGWDNAIFRLGDHWAIRLPRRQAAAILIENEQTWLPQLSAQLPIPVPTPYRIGKPGKGYPWHWTVVPWLAGTTADQAELHADQAQHFVAFLQALHMPAPLNAPINTLRGIPLEQRAASMEERIQRLETRTNLITPPIRNIWDLSLKTPVDVEAKWLHGDLHPRNILVEHGVITGIIDWGDITSGDIATDLASIWMLFSAQKTRQQAIQAYTQISAATLLRAKGWAILFGVLLLDTGLVDNPRHAAIGEKTLRRVAEDS